MTELTFDALLERVKVPKRTAIICHRNPDPDTLGSAMGLMYILSYFGSEAKIVCSDRLPERSAFITDNTEIFYSGDFSEFERAVAVDVAAPAQMGELSHIAEKVDFTIDHHTMSTRFSDYYMEDCAACAQIIFKIADALGLCDKLDMGFFSAVYAGMSGDTGCFKYSNVTEETHIIASRLVKKGIDHAEINRLIFDSKTFKEIVGQRLTYEHMRLELDNTLAVIMFTNKLKEDNSLTDEDIGDVVNYIRQIKGVSVAISIKQSPRNEHKFNVSSRSNLDIDVSKVCAIFGGGGHIRAAGCTVSADSPEEAERIIISAFSEEMIKNGR